MQISEKPKGNFILEFSSLPPQNNMRLPLLLFLFFILQQSISYSQDFGLNDEVISAMDDEETKDDREPRTGSGVKMLTSSFDYNKTQNRIYRQQQNRKKEIEQKIQRVRSFGYDRKATHRFKVVFHNMSDIDEEAFAEKVEFQMWALNRDFMMEGVDIYSHDGKDNPYLSSIDTADISFDLDSRNFEGSNVQQEWRNWNDNKTDAVEAGAINIWIIDTPDSVGSYASYPEGEAAFDGIVLDVDFFAEGFGVYNEGKTLTFLMGEYFGLKPLYGAQACGDDRVFDTPTHSAPITTCLSTIYKSSCDHRFIMPMNYMSISPDACKYLFSKGQVRRMKQIIDLSTSLQEKLITQNSGK